MHLSPLMPDESEAIDTLCPTMYLRIVISVFLAVAKDLASLLDHFRREDRALRDRTAAIISDVADALRKRQSGLRRGRPARPCAENSRSTPLDLKTHR